GAHGLFCAFQTTVNPGDEVLFFSPYWTPIRDQVRYCGGVPILVPWEERLPGLESRVTERTRVLYLNSPSNPTGIVLTRDALAAIRHGVDHLAEMRNEYRHRRDLLVTALNDAGFRCPSPSGAFYLFPDVRERLGNDSWAAMEQLLTRTSIASVPGAVFGSEGEGHLRMSFSTSIDVIE